MTGGSWPYKPEQCPRCLYLHALEPFLDDSGYQIHGFCRHPRIAMELFAPQQRALSQAERCRLFVPEDRAGQR